jgi:hypothetical protein
MKEDKIKRIERKVLLAEAVFILGALVYLFFATSPSQVYPIHGMTVSDPNFNIEIQNGQEALISTDENFTSPITLGVGSQILLPPGTYYWKVKGTFRESKVESFVIEPNVGLEIKERPQNYELQNSGNVDLNVTKKNQGITSSITLDRGDSKEVEKDNSSYQGGQA